MQFTRILGAVIPQVFDSMRYGNGIKGYTSFVVQDLVIRRHVVNFRCERGRCRMAPR